MINPMTRLQKLIAYTSLIIVLAWTVFGIYTIWLYIGHEL